MRINSKLFILVIIVSVITGCSNWKSADWAFNFVVWDEYIYKVSDDYIEAIDQEIGAVTKYSDRAGTYSGNFSNKYKKGTTYYSIKGISTDEAIAIQEEDGSYKKAIRDGKYGE
ncbi:hypothetical protein [Sporosarcina sp. NPDC096371]|uniref:hypothetical protein n=1 Tax=Sporosarcina sp. NPDC096371 TaxID=3364530 RepID=UPI0038204BAB